QCLRVFRRDRRSHSHRSDRHERRRPPSNSVSLKLDVFTRPGARADARAGAPSRRHARAAPDSQGAARGANQLQAARQKPRLLGRSNASIVGRYDRDENGMGYVAPFDRRVLMDIFVPPGQEGGASPREMVVVELTRWPTATRGAIGHVTQVLGDIDAPGVDTEIIIRKYGIPDEHSREAVAEAVRLGTQVAERDIRGRSDFRSMPT